MPKFIFSVGPGAPFSKRVCGVPSFSRGRDNLQPRPPPAAAQPKFGSKNPWFFLPSPKSPFDKCMCATTPEKTHRAFVFNKFCKKGHFVVLEVFVQKLAKLGRAGHVAACRWACRSMSLGMSQHVAAMFVRVAGHVAACRSTFGICRWACRSISCHFWACCDISLGSGRISGQNLSFLAWPAPLRVFRTARAHKRPEVSVFFAKGEWGLKEGDFTLQRESNDFSAVAL